MACFNRLFFWGGSSGVAPARAAIILAGALANAGVSAQSLDAGLLLVVDAAPMLMRVAQSQQLAALDIASSHRLPAISFGRAPERSAFNFEAKRTGALQAETSFGATSPRLHERGAEVSAMTKRDADSLSRGASRLSLEDLIGLAIQAHPEVAAKRAYLDAARAGEGAARWEYFPTPSLQLRRTGKGQNVAVAAIEQPLWSGGRIDAGLDAASSRARSADVAISETQYTLALRLTGAWQSWLQARGRVEALTKGLALLDVYAESVRRRVQGDIAPEVDRKLVQSRVAQVQGDLAAARAAERVAVSQLAQLIGRPLRSEELDPGKGVETQLPALEVLVEKSIDRSAALRRIDAEVEAAQYEVAQKRAALLPTLGVRAEYQRGDLSNTGKTTHDSSVMLVLNYVPGAGLSAGAGIDAAKARVISLEESREAAKRELIAKMVTDYEDYLSSLRRKQEVLRTLEATSEVLGSYDRLFIAGKRNWLDVLNTARELTQVQSSLSDVEALHIASYYRLRLHSSELTWQQ